VLTVLEGEAELDPVVLVAHGEVGGDGGPAVDDDGNVDVVALETLVRNVESEVSVLHLLERG
jgi:hypothetical protein